MKSVLLNKVRNLTVCDVNDPIKDGDEVVTTDAQFLTTYEDYKPNVVKEQKVTQETAKLPITYDSIALIVILVIIVAALVVVYIRMKKINQKDEK